MEKAAGRYGGSTPVIEDFYKHVDMSIEDPDTGVAFMTFVPGFFEKWQDMIWKSKVAQMYAIS